MTFLHDCLWHGECWPLSPGALGALNDCSVGVPQGGTPWTRRTLISLCFGTCARALMPTRRTGGPRSGWRAKCSDLLKRCSPYLQYSRMSSGLVFCSGLKWRGRSGAFDSAWNSKRTRGASMRPRGGYKVILFQKLTDSKFSNSEPLDFAADAGGSLSGCGVSTR